VVELRRPLGEAITALRQFDWDHDTELVVLTRSAAARVLEEYLAGGFTEEDCRQWADTVESRDDVRYEHGREELLGEFLYELSTPEIVGRLSPDLARAWLGRLRAA